MVTAKELASRPERFYPGHRACSGCGFPQAIRFVLKAARNPVVVSVATGCLEVTSTAYPYTAWNCSFIHSAFENTAATMSGIVGAYEGLKRFKGDDNRQLDFIAFGGDGGSYDIGFQALSGAMERGHDFLYVCYDNGSYANTGVQRSGATPRGAHTTTTPAGDRSHGKPQFRKDLTGIIAAHNIPYVAQSAISHWRDVVTKAEKGLAVKGPAFLNIMAPCRLTWGTPPEETIDVTRHAVESCFWPLYEVEDGNWVLNFRPKKKRSFIDWLRRQRRFSHLFRKEKENVNLLQELEDEVENRWKRLLERCQEPH